MSEFSKFIKHEPIDDGAYSPLVVHDGQAASIMQGTNNDIPIERAPTELDNEPEPVTAEELEALLRQGAAPHEAPQPVAHVQLAFRLKRSAAPPPELTTSLIVPVPPRSLRTLSRTQNGDMYQLETVCWTACRDQPRRHVLICGHQTDTADLLECGTNCKLNFLSENKAPGPQLVCHDKACVQRRRKAQSIFMPKPKQRAYNLRARAAAGLTAKRRNEQTDDGDDDDDAKSLFLGDKSTSQSVKRRKTLLPSERVGSATEYKSQPAPKLSYNDRKDLEDEAFITADKTGALQKLVSSVRGPGVRPLSRFRDGFALTAERTTEAAARKLGAKNLFIDGSDKLAFRADSNPDFAKQDEVIFGADEKELPHSYANRTRRGQRAIRNENAGMFSVPEATYNQMVEDEAGIVSEYDGFGSRLKLPRNQIEDNAFEGHQATYCVCRTTIDTGLIECIQCNKSFHPVCVGKELDEEADDDTVVAHGTAKDLGIRVCDGCEGEIVEVRYRCLDCDEFDFCRDCFQNRAGNHPDDHSFERIRVLAQEDDGEAPVDMLTQVARDAFTCTHCDQKRKSNQALANQTFAKKSIVAQLRDEVARTRKLKVGGFAANQTDLQVQKRMDLGRARSEAEKKQIKQQYADLGVNDSSLHAVKDGRVRKPAAGRYTRSKMANAEELMQVTGGKMVVENE